ncbi:MAG: DUF932 domain-containing protein [Bacteroidota bacterium]
MNPYAHIEVTPLFSKDGMKSQGKSVRIEDAESKTGWNELGVVSPNYLLIHNTQVKETVDTIAERSKINDWKPGKQFFDGRRFVYTLTTDTITAEITKGDIVRFGLIAYNSYDGSRALSVGMYAEHLICANGMTSEMYFAKHSFRHNQGNITWSEQTEKAFALLLPNSRTRLTRFAKTIGALKQKDLVINDLQTIREAHLKELSASLWGKVVDRYLSHESHTAFGLLDACTHSFWHHDKETFADFRNNSYSTDGMINYAQLLSKN